MTALRPMTPADLGRVLELEPVLFGRDAWSRQTYATELTWPGRYYVVVDVDAFKAHEECLIVGVNASVLHIALEALSRSSALLDRVAC